MKWQTQLITIVTAGLFVITVLYLIRKKRLKEEYSLLWLVASIVIVIVVAFARQIVSLLNFVNPESSGEILFFFIIVAQLGFILLFSVKLSFMKDENKNLAQSVTLLQGRVDALGATRKERTPVGGKRKPRATGKGGDGSTGR